MRQLDLFSALLSSAQGIDTGFKSACSDVANIQGDTIVLGVAKKRTGLVRVGVLVAAPLRAISQLPSVQI
jgi:hypothetical protein